MKKPRASAGQTIRAHEGAAPVAPAGHSVRVAELFTAAALRHRAARLAEAEVIYRQILALDPNLVEAHNNLAAALRGMGKLDHAAESFQRAIALKPDNAEAHSNLGVVLRDLGRFDEAVASCRRAISQKANYAEAHNNLGNALRDRGDLGEAIVSYQRAIVLKPNYAEAHNNLANALKELGKLDEAVTSYQRAIAFNPNLAEVHNNLGGALRDLGKLDQAVMSFQRAIMLNPANAEAHNNLGNAFEALGHFHRAAACFQRTIVLKPDDAEPHNNLGNALSDLGRFDEAMASYQRAISLDPAYAEAHNNLGNALKELGRFEEAIASYQRAIALRPDYATPHNNLGNVLKDLGQVEEALESYRRAITLKPDYVDADSNRLFCLNYASGVSSEALLAEHRAWDRRHASNLAAPIHANSRDPERQLRIGYVSGDFHAHPVGYFLTSVLAAHDPSVMEMFCYSNSAAEDDRTAKLRAAVDHWRSLVGVPDEDAAAMIRRDGIDILVDLSGHTAGNRLVLFTHRPAPVQASWLGYPGTTGLSSIDYLLMDAAAVPEGAERWCSETVVRLPHGRFCYAPPDYAPDVIDRNPRDNAPVTFGSFNYPTKIGPDVVRVWAEVLKAVPGSRLVLKWRRLDDPTLCRRFGEAFAAAGVEPERLELREQSPHAEMLAEYGGIDIALDPFPFCGGLTSCEALWMGVPVVTLPGETIASRQTLGFLEVLGLDGLAAKTEADYVRIAADLAADPARRAGLRASLRPRMVASPLCDGPSFSSTLETAYRQMWRGWCAGELVDD